MLLNSSYNPDVLSCLANLRNDEVFTPPGLANEILDLLPSDLWSNRDTKFLDPVCKSGVFLREIAKRLLVGLEKEIPDLQERIDHIFHNQIYGIAMTELTGLLSRRSVYCSKTANGEFSIAEFDEEQGNIVFNRTNHRWKSDRCEFCGASKGEYNRSKDLETHAYQLIHTDKPEKIFNMKFDVIIGNPPYQLNDGGGMGTSAMPIYHKFIQQAKKLDPRYILMIVPSRWFSGGKGLDEFRDEMLSENRLSEIHDFVDATDVFPGVQIKGGVNYFLWDKSYNGNCRVTNYYNGKPNEPVLRPLKEKNCPVFIRYNEAISIFRKVQSRKEPTLEKEVSSRKPYGIDSNFKDFKSRPDDTHSIRLYRFGDTGYIRHDQVLRNTNWIYKLKVIISKAGSGSDAFPHQILGIPMISEPGSVSTETYIVLGTFDNLKSANNLISYVSTRFFRFMVSLMKNTQNAPKNVYSFVPIQDFSESWTDEKLYAKYGISEDEIAFIESMIRPMDLPLFQ